MKSIGIALAVVVLLSIFDGQSAAAKKVTKIKSKNIADRTIIALDIALGTITGSEIADGALTGADVADGNLTGADIGDATITGADIADGHLSGVDIGDGTLTDVDISSAAAISAGKINFSAATISSVAQLDVDNIRLDGNTVAALNDSGLLLYDNGGNGIAVQDGGNVDMSAHAAIGDSAATSPYTLLNISGTVDDYYDFAGGYYGLKVTPTFDFNDELGSNLVGLYAKAEANLDTSSVGTTLIGSSITAKSNAGSNIDIFYGSSDSVEINNSVEHTVNDAYGSTGQVTNYGASNVGDAIGGAFSVSNNGSGTILRGYGVVSMIYGDSGSPLNTGYGLTTVCGDVATCYGVYVDAGKTGVTTDWGLYETGADKNYLSASIGVGITSPGAKLDVYTDSAAGYAAKFSNDGNNANRYGLLVQAGADDGSGTTYYLNANDGNGTNVGYLANVSGTFALTDVSDLQTKTNIEDTKLDGLSIIGDLRVVDFNRKQNENGPTLHGFIAQEVEKVFPDMVVKGPDGYLSVAKELLIPVMVKAMQQQQDALEILDARIGALEKTPSQVGSGTLANLAWPDGVSFDKEGNLVLSGGLKAGKLEADQAVIGSLKVGHLELANQEDGKAVNNEPQGQLVGRHEFQVGEDAVEVEAGKLDEDSQILVTFHDNPGGSYWVKIPKDGAASHEGFVVHLSTPAKEKLSFSWLVFP